MPLPHGLVASREFEGLDLDCVTIASVLDCHDHRETLRDKANGSTGTKPDSWVDRIVHLTQSGILSSKGNGKRSQSGWKKSETQDQMRTSRSALMLMLHVKSEIEAFDFGHFTNQRKVRSTLLLSKVCIFRFRLLSPL